MSDLDLLNLRRNVLSGATRRPAIDAFLEADARTGQAPQQTVQQTPGSVVENARQRALMALGASPKPSMGIPQARLVTPTAAASGLRSMLPGRGTPGSAALGAFGSTMSQLGGYQDKPMTFGQILGASLGEARKAYATAEERKAAIAEKKAAAERQAKLDRLNELKTLADIAATRAPKKPTIITRTLASGEKQDFILDPKSPKSDDYGLAPYGDPYSSIKDVAPTSLMQNVEATFGDLTSPEAKAALKAGLEGSTKGNFQAKGTVVDKDGVELGAAVFDTSTGQTMLSVTGADGEELVPMPRGSNVISVGQESKVIYSATKLDNLEQEIDLSVASMNGLTSYLESIDKAPVGLNRLYNNFVADTKTLFSDLVNADIEGKKFTDLTEGQLNSLLARGKLQSLIGQFRLETVGGGVMTEQDAIRILWSLGGDVNALQQPSVVKDAMTRMFKKKYKNLNRQIRQYNRQVRHPVYDMQGYQEIEMPEFDESLLSEKVVKQSAKTKFKQGGAEVVDGTASNASPSVEITKAPAGVDQDVWDIMKPDEKALWQ